MRIVLVRDVVPEPEDAQRLVRLLKLLSIGLERWLSGQPVSEEMPPNVDYSPNLSPTSYANVTVPNVDD